ncbi:hypothetical protein HU200_036498 [Digitaria exilis]|uniref:Protein kinase domain-containing protein n=1 Tax=Digitaria exilis TaxID=1010633 RepID=A0A835BS87_9POAL|nr:hypothetical protein HU200_036498 [Digitaria exilis]
MVVAAADVPLQSSGGSSGRSIARPAAFPIAPHEFFHRRIPAAPRETTAKKAEGDDELRLPDLEHVCHLGEGACGVVTKVRHRRTGAVFALKTAHYSDPNGATADEEAEALLRCAGSPHVVRCHAVLAAGDDAPAAYVLELMDAGTLGDVLARRRGGRGGIPELALAEVAARCLEGLAHVHSRGVAHLDLRPDNLLANSSGDVKIGDFSVSRILYGRAGERHRRRVSVAVGSPMYLSPERFVADAHAGPRGAMAADVWGFGVTVMELFLGRCPFLLPGRVRPSFDKLSQAICDGEPPSLPESSGASPELREFVAACLQKDPRRRATVAQLLTHPFVARRHVDESRRALRELLVEKLE